MCSRLLPDHPKRSVSDGPVGLDVQLLLLLEVLLLLLLVMLVVVAAVVPLRLLLLVPIFRSTGAYIR